MNYIIWCISRYISLCHYAINIILYDMLYILNRIMVGFIWQWVSEWLEFTVVLLAVQNCEIWIFGSKYKVRDFQFYVDQIWLQIWNEDHSPRLQLYMVPRKCLQSYMHPLCTCSHMRRKVIIEQVLESKLILTIINNLKKIVRSWWFFIRFDFSCFFVIFVIKEKFKSTDCDGSIFSL